MSANWVGRTLGKVQIEAPIARGGMADVYLGTHITLQRKVAVKILRNPDEGQNDAFERFEREARVVAKLRHPNIVQIYDFDKVDNDPYIVMEYIQGLSLSKYLNWLHQNNQTLELPHIFRLIRGIASALQYAHNNGIIHRDIKPGNILLISPTKAIEVGKPLPDDFEPVLTDFGLVRFLDSARHTTTGATAGTPAYMSPEQAQGVATDGRTDIYSLGIVLYELLAGKLPFDGETTMSILLKHVTEPPKPIPGLPFLIQQVLNRALAKNVNERFQTPMELVNALSTAADINPATMQMDSIPTSPEPATIDFHDVSPLLAEEDHRRPRISNWIRVAILGAIALLVGAFLFFNGTTSSDVTETPASTEPPITNTTNPTGTSTSTRTPTSIPVLLETSVVLHFQDGDAIADQAVLEARRMPLAPAGKQFEVWLMTGRKRISLGILNLDANGTGTLAYMDPQGTNLVALYNQAEITIEPENDTNPASSGLVAYSYTLPPEELTNVRYLLSTNGNTPNKIALIQGLYTSIKKVNELAVKLQASLEAGDEAQARRHAEAILNLIAGSQSPNYKDWDGDGTITDESDGYGLSLNGSNPGYFQAVYSEANSIVKSTNASEPMVTYGEYLKTTIQNLAQWTQQLEQLALAIFNTPDQVNVSELVTLTNQMLNGMDLDNNGTVDPQPGESGVQFAYQYAYSMANMPLINMGLLSTPLPGGQTSTGDSSGTNNNTDGGGSAGSVATPKPGNTPPGQVKTDKPKDTPGGGGGGNNNNNKP